MSMKVIQNAEIEVPGGMTLVGPIEDPEVVANLQSLSEAAEEAVKALLEAAEEAGLQEVAGEPAPALRAHVAPSKGKTGPDAADVRAWAATLTKPSLPLSAQGRIPAWVNEAFQKKLKGEALDKHARQRASSDFLKKYDEANKKK